MPKPDTPLILVTRPEPDNAATAAALRARAYAVVLAPMLQFEALTIEDDPDAQYRAVIVTSANALRALDGQSLARRWTKLPVLAVGTHTARAAKDFGFTDVIEGHGGAEALRDLVLTRLAPDDAPGESAQKKKSKRKSAARAGEPGEAGPLLYLAGADVAYDLAGALGERGLSVVTQTTYRMKEVSRLPADAADALASGRIAAVLHYSRRSARAFMSAIRHAGLEISALALPQCCMSDAVALALRDAGAVRVAVAKRPDEDAMLDALGRLVPVSKS